MNDQLSSDLASLRIVRDAPRPPSRWGKVVVAFAALGVIAGGAALAYPTLQAKMFKTEVEVGEIGLASPSQAAVDLTSTGYVVPQVVVKIGPKVSGRVAAVHVAEGQDVKAGDVLFELDPSDQKSALASAQARVMTARAKAQAARARAVTARARSQSARANVAEIQSQFDQKQKLAAAGAAPQGSADDLDLRVGDRLQLRADLRGHRHRARLLLHHGARGRVLPRDPGRLHLPGDGHARRVTLSVIAVGARGD